MSESCRSELSSQRTIARRDSNGLIIIPASSLGSDSVKDGGVLVVVECSSTCDCYGDNSRGNSELLMRSRENSVTASLGSDSVKTVNLSMQQQPQGTTTPLFVSPSIRIILTSHVTKVK